MLAELSRVLRCMYRKKGDVAPPVLADDAELARLPCPPVSQPRHV